MCGLVGVLSTNRPLDSHVGDVRAMVQMISHRGPDGQAVLHLPGKAVLGHCRLAVIDIELGKQPMVSADQRYYLIFNGEIYNYLELRRNLVGRGHVFRTESDTEVLLNLLIEYGSDALTRINGMFAFLFLDSRSNSWIAARDPFGIKPLYVTQGDGLLMFSSEIKAFFAHPEIEPRRNDEGLAQYMHFQFALEEGTLFKDIQKVKPGCVLKGVGSQIKAEIRYWDLQYRVDEKSNERHFLERLRFLLDDSIRLQIQSDVPVGGYLSGGIDSSIVCTLAAQHYSGHLPVFHGKFLEGPQYDESNYASDVAHAIGSDRFDAVISPQQFVDELPRLIYLLDEPIAGPGAFAQLMVSRLASDHVKVILGGQGGDEIFGGYARYLVGYLEQALKGAIFGTQEEGNHVVTLETIISHLPMLKDYIPLLDKFWRRGLFENMSSRYFHLLDRNEDPEESWTQDFAQTIDRKGLFAQFEMIFNRPQTKSYINKMTYFDQQTILPALLHIEDRVSMGASIEARVPLLDTRIVELVAQMPPSMKFEGGHTKHILKKAIADYLPKSVSQRNDKMGFPVPLEKWSKTGVLRDFISDILMSDRCRSRGIYRSTKLAKLVDEPGTSSRDLWGALSLELWHRNFIDAV